MANDGQEKPLAPKRAIQPFPITVDEELSIELRKQRKGFRKCTICCGIITAILLIIAVIMLILGFTVLHVKNPKINMNSVSIMGFDPPNVTTNLTVVADVSVKNTNVAAFKFEKSNSSLLYHGMVVGLGDIPRGVAKARRTLRLNVTFDVTVAKIVGKQEFQSDLGTGKLPFQSYTKINGRVKILNIIKRKVTVTMNCSIGVNVTNGAIVDQDCKKRVLI
ncbi:late embryogenesis abundant (LEA) hydroxyproline-rich glycoprotein family [Artemisia annua]|uniref:Late embryogenesis abundant (LEA) hydroxyproline-rich glycoprotein family n=1 Tax=Artemisia annua TaxID=35608 RepID=A0A2U1P348_ARTAN|nr:late embryogenesis abundant (LEA) hydroxyproline-rich glycoprotein family [Artemisia annua]